LVVLAARHFEDGEAPDALSPVRFGRRPHQMVIFQGAGPQPDDHDNASPLFAGHIGSAARAPVEVGTSSAPRPLTPATSNRRRARSPICDQKRSSRERTSASVSAPRRT
jgi:hypothetical protein